MREPRPPRRPPARPGRSTPRPRPDIRVAADGLSETLGDVLGSSGAPADIRDRLSDILATPDVPRPDPGGRGTGPVRPEGPQFEIRPISADVLIDVADKLPDHVFDAPRPGRLEQTADLLLGTLRKIDPKVLPARPLPEGGLGARLPLPDRLAAPLVRQAAADIAKSGERVLWDDGVNQLLVDIGGITSEAGDKRITVSIPVRCDQVGTTMKVPFATGGEGRVAGLVTAAPDRPLGDDLVAQIWGDALIALAHQSLLSMAGALAAASGRDERNETLVPRALHAEPGLLRLDTEARRRLKGIAP